MYIAKKIALPSAKTGRYFLCFIIITINEIIAQIIITNENKLSYVTMASPPRNKLGGQATSPLRLPC